MTIFRKLYNFIFVSRVNANPNIGVINCKIVQLFYLLILVILDKVYNFIFGDQY
ncbi:hypothetical protein NIES4072_18000 [Nostoc commune NIES-4072]|uniref:Uncharacterized protein n=1 Tax=Nostoc commune NIES-4072 TaxID=2005467 RepID=A0A2R5FHJ7_NOSCO|nr:hypothetical protein NIES4070_08810 [Nostoc commune HK-02]GBG18136.1 hypothetical protein NIES4072_18000 [Nostoc commune NIES-4072]